MAKNMLIWAIFKTIGCLRILGLEPVGFEANGLRKVNNMEANIQGHLWLIFPTAVPNIPYDF